jgi:hypothetical protein
MQSMAPQARPIRLLLIHQGHAPTPRSPEDWARLSQEEQNAV